jgi:hypothetical protein
MSAGRGPGRPPPLCPRRVLTEVVIMHEGGMSYRPRPVRQDQERTMKMDPETSESVADEQLVEAFNMLISHALNRSDGDRFPIEEDFFWSVPVAEMNNVYSDPPALTVGQISESWGNMEAMLADNSPVSYGLIWLADILRAVGKTSAG